MALWLTIKLQGVFQKTNSLPLLLLPNVFGWSLLFSGSLVVKPSFTLLMSFRFPHSDNRASTGKACLIKKNIQILLSLSYLSKGLIFASFMEQQKFTLMRSIVKDNERQCFLFYYVLYLPFELMIHQIWYQSALHLRIYSNTPTHANPNPNQLS